MAELNITLYTPHEKQLEVHNDTHRFKVLNWGRRTGKSTLAANLTLMAATQVIGRYWIVAPRRESSLSAPFNSMTEPFIRVMISSCSFFFLTNSRGI